MARRVSCKKRDPHDRDRCETWGGSVIVPETEVREGERVRSELVRKREKDQIK